jgi:hypothetical protein
MHNQSPNPEGAAMKKFTTNVVAAAIVMIASTAHAQITIGSERIPVVGDRYTTTRMDTAGVSEGAPGGAMVWNFSGLTPSGESYVIEYLDASTTLYADSFPSATLAAFFVADADTSYSYFSTGSGRLAAHGHAGSAYFMHYNDTEIQLATPLIYNDQYTDAFGGRTESSEGYTLQSSGTITVKNDGYGNIMLPGGASAVAARVKFVRIVNDTIFMNGVPVMSTRTTTTSYEWFTPNAKFPVVQIAYLEQVSSTGGSLTLKEVEYNTMGTTGVDPDPRGNVATTMQLDQNYPNPFNPSTVITFRTASDDLVTLKLYNLLGQEITTLINGRMKAGAHSVSFNAVGLPSGTYLYRLQSGDRVETRKMSIVK